VRRHDRELDRDSSALPAFEHVAVDGAALAGLHDTMESVPTPLPQRPRDNDMLRDNDIREISPYPVTKAKTRCASESRNGQVPLDPPPPYTRRNDISRDVASLLSRRRRLLPPAALTGSRLRQIAESESGKRLLVDLSARFQLLLLLE